MARRHGARIDRRGDRARSRARSERALARLLADLVGVATSAHDLSDGGLAQALTEAALVGGTGASVDVSEVAGDAFVALFSESAARAIVTVAPEDVEELRALCARHDVPMTELGTTGGDALVVEGAFDVPLAELRTAWQATLPAAFGD